MSVYSTKISLSFFSYHTDPFNGKDGGSEEEWESAALCDPWHPVRGRKSPGRHREDVVENGAHAHELDDVGQDGKGREVAEVADRAHQEHGREHHQDVVAVVQL